MNVEYLSLKGYDRGGCLQAHPPHRRRVGDHQHPVCNTDPTRHLQGVLSVRDLLLADEDDRIEGIEDSNESPSPRWTI